MVLCEITKRFSSSLHQLFYELQPTEGCSGKAKPSKLYALCLVDFFY